MFVPVSIQKKQAFLYWMLDNLKIEAHDMSWFFQDLIDNEQALHNLHFVDDITDCPKGMIITSHLNEQIYFQFFKGKVRSDDVYTAYHEINLYREEPMFIQINFPFCNENNLYQAVIEDEILLQPDVTSYTENMLNNILTQSRTDFLQEQINIALEDNHYEDFIYYSSQLKQLKIMNK